MQNFASGVPRKLLADATSSSENFEIVCSLLDFDGQMLGRYPNIQGGNHE